MHQKLSKLARILVSNFFIFKKIENFLFLNTFSAIVPTETLPTETLKPTESATKPSETDVAKPGEDPAPEPDTKPVAPASPAEIKTKISGKIYTSKKAGAGTDAGVDMWLTDINVSYL